MLIRNRSIHNLRIVNARIRHRWTLIGTYTDPLFVSIRGSKTVLFPPIRGFLGSPLIAPACVARRVRSIHNPQDHERSNPPPMDFNRHLHGSSIRVHSRF